jgi:peptidoglycan/LPS O-acetylase OafA/YrhL
MNNVTARNFGLDLFRAVAILLVVFSHGKFLLNGTSIENFPFFKMLDGVDLFFVLSGFLIGGIILRTMSEGMNWRDVAHFWKRRWLRTLPNYYLILLLNFLFVSYGIISGDLTVFGWKFMVFLQNFSKPLVGFFWESWSLAVEEWFYIFTPLMLWVLLKKFKLKVSFLIVTLVLMLGPLLYRAYSFDPTLDDFWFDVKVRKVVLMRLDAISFGLLLAWIFYYLKEFWQKWKQVAFILGIGLIVFLLNFHPSNSTFFKQVYYFTLTPLAIALVLPWAEGITCRWKRLVSVVTHISKISYSMYLINLALVAQVIGLNFPVTGNADGIMKYVLYLGIVIGASSLLYYFVERPILRWRDNASR